MYHTSQQLVRAVLQKMYVRRSPLEVSFSHRYCVCFSVNELSKWPSIGIDNSGDDAALGCEGQTGSLDEGYLNHISYFVHVVRGFYP